MKGLLYLKMDIGFILIVSILVLGGVIATVGDRIGTRVGKARLSLFKLRPRRTAVLVTIVTGIVISGSTLAILLATSKSLRTGLFQVDEIQKQLRKAHGELERTLVQKQQTEAQKNQTEKELAKAIGQKNQTEKELARTTAQKQQTEKELAKTTAQKQQTEQELAKTTAQKEQELAITTAQKQQTESELTKNVAQQNQIKSELTKTKTEKAEAQKRLNLTKEREQQLRQAIARRETLLSKQEQQLQSQNQQLQEREKQLTFLQQELTTMEQYYQDYQALRQGNVALLRGQVLASRVLRIVDSRAARQAVDQLLSEAHRTAIGATHPTHSKADEPVVQITSAQVEQLIGQIKDGRDYVVRILSAGNYVVGEKQVRVFADAALNQVVFYSGDVLATTSTDPSKMSEEEIRQQLEQLIAASEFRARRAGLIGDEFQIGDGRITTIIGFIEQMKQYDKPVDLKVVVEEDTYTAGPLKMNLVAIRDGKVVYST